MITNIKEIHEKIKTILLEIDGDFEEIERLQNKIDSKIKMIRANTHVIQKLRKSLEGFE